MNQKMAALREMVLTGDREKKVADLTQDLLNQGINVETILDEGLIAAMDEAGKRFQEREYFVPELIVAARAMDRALKVVQPLLEKSGAKKRGAIVLGTVRGDQHDIGKNLVAMMFKGAGFEVIDLGHDVHPDKFVEATRLHKPNVVGMSALLTTTMINMEEVINRLKEAGLRKETMVIVGGAPLSRKYADKIGADLYAATAPMAVAVVRERLLDQQKGD